MTATDELRRMLDERGIDWGKTTFGRGTVWDGEYGTVVAVESEEVLSMLYDTDPAQAIEATLGRGTCEMQRFESDTNMTRFGWRCTECGMASIGFGRPNYCPKCGRRVVAGDAS